MSGDKLADIRVFLGRSGSGKGLAVRRAISETKPKRLIVYDVYDEYGDLLDGVELVKLPELISRLKGLEYQNGQDVGKLAGFAYRVMPGSGAGLFEKERDEFNFLCQVVFVVGALTFLAEELSNVTSAVNPPAWWRKITSQGRHRRLSVIGVSQRAAGIDKMLLTNATELRASGFRYKEDCRASAVELGISYDDVRLLRKEKIEGGAVCTAWRVLEDGVPVLVVTRVDGRGVKEVVVSYDEGSTLLRGGSISGFFARGKK